ncbi:hypothetical protein [Halorientalis salina]|uniref:hypothetical protein n=1 Tax=Halorientalis salina TaxID=2932266 RepID=UPI0010AB960E|nr:hypothetical protein [Halorientalis salina]
MSNAPSTVERGDGYYHVRYRDPDEFDDIRTPDWAERPAGSVVEGAEVRTGDTKDDDDWTVQSVLIPSGAVDTEDEAREAAQAIVEKLSE